MKSLILILISITLLSSCGKAIVESDTENPVSSVEIGNKTITTISGSSVQSIR